MAEAVNASSSACGWCYSGLGPNVDRQTRHLFVQSESADDQVPVRFQFFIASFVDQMPGWLLVFSAVAAANAAGAGALAASRHLTRSVKRL